MARSSADTLIRLILELIFGLFRAGVESGARYQVNVRNGIPFCVSCNRQVSYRRSQCRACGYEYKFYGRTPEEQQRRDESNARLSARRAVEREAARQERGVLNQERARLRRERNAARDQAYKARGVDPGAFAWFRALPDLGQALLVGVCAGVPVILVLIAVLQPPR